MADNISISDTDNTIDNIEISMSDTDGSIDNIEISMSDDETSEIVILSDNAGDDTTETIILSDGSSIDTEKMSLVDTDYTSITDRLSTLENTVDTLTPFIFEQSVASDTWVVEHNLGRVPSITLVDQYGKVFRAEREYPIGYETTKVIIYLSGATTGKVLLN